MSGGLGGEEAKVPKSRSRGERERGGLDVLSSVTKRKYFEGHSNSKGIKPKIHYGEGRVYWAWRLRTRSCERERGPRIGDSGEESEEVTHLLVWFGRSLDS